MGDVGRVVGLGAAAYVVMVIVLRVSGKRTLAKLNAFDLVVTVALGSVLATIALSSDVSLVDGVAAIVVLVAAQWAVSWASVHTSLAQRMVRAEATVVFPHGRFDDAALSKVRLTRGEVCQAIRSSGCGDLEPVAAVRAGDRRQPERRHRRSLPHRQRHARHARRSRRHRRAPANTTKGSRS